MTMMIGPGVTVAEQHGDHEDVPGKLQREVSTDEDIAPRCLDRCENRLEAEVGQHLGYCLAGLLALLRFQGLPGAVRGFCGHCGDVYPAQSASTSRTQ